MPGIIGLEQGDAAFGFLARNLAEDVLGELILEFAEGRHPIVDPIEQEENADAGEQPAGEADEEALDQAGPDRDRERWPFP